MSLRAWLAGKAISVVRPVYEVTSNPNELDGEQLPPFSKIRADVIAREACEVADALIAELGQEEAEIQAPEGKKFKFMVGDAVRILYGDNRTPAVGRRGVVVDVHTSYKAWYRYTVRIDESTRFGYHEGELQAVEDDGPKFKEGDRVWVKPGADRRFTGKVAVVDVVTRKDSAGGWVYEISIPICDKDDRLSTHIYESWLESQEERAGDE
ncbi:MAG: hypothetical protein V3W28_05975 [Thermoplasmata archaeon]